MKISPILILLLALSFVIPAAASGNDGFIPLSEIRAGMKGVGKTAFEGNKIEEFPVEILGVLEHVTPGLDLIIARAGGERIKEAGIVAGMSGSPVYVDGKLIGAIAYGWQFSKEAIAGITPIEIMVEERRPLRVGSLIELGKKGPGEPVPIGTPLLLSGFDFRLYGEMGERLSLYGFVLATSGGKGGQIAESLLVPGAPVGAQLVGGDANATAIGTVTHREGAKLFAFGHPMLWAGEVSLPMTGAYVHAIIPSQRASLKVASALKTVGAITRDTETGISGYLGMKPSVTPVWVKITNSETGSEEFNYTVAREKELLPVLVGVVSASSFLSKEKSVGESTVDVKLRVVLDDSKEVKRRNLVVSSLPSTSLIQEISEPISRLIENDFKEVEVREVFVEISSETGRRAAVIEGLRVSDETIQPGSEVELTVFLRPFGKEPQEKRIRLVLPDELPFDELTLRVGGGYEREEWRRKKEAPVGGARDFGKVLEEFEEGGLSQFIFVELSSPDKGFFVGGKEFPLLPGSFTSVLASSKEKGLRALSPTVVLKEERIETQYSLIGSHDLKLKVRR